MKLKFSQPLSIRPMQLQIDNKPTVWERTAKKAKMMSYLTESHTDIGQPYELSLHF
jgi:hypothetical protein